MRLHSLQMSAFGPFAEEAVVDFDALGCDGLFLLHGQTGAGKTTVLDAVAFALFGRVPGARDTDRRLVSDHATAGDIPRVVLEATIGGRRMRVARSPEHRRRKKRGDGFTTVPAAGTLVWLDGSGPGLSRLSDIGEVISRILGMSAEQFFQVVLLPQGDFARFLRAATDDRETLLEKLFETDRFNDLEGWLRDRARATRVERGEREQTVDRIAAQIAGLVGDDHPTEGDPDWAQTHLDTAGVEATEAAAELHRARASAQAADAALAVATRTHDLQERAALARTRLAALDSGHDLLESARHALDAARRAEPIRPLIDDRDRAAERDVRAQATLADATRSVPDDPEGASLLARLSWPPADSDTATIDAHIDRWSAESGRLAPVAERAGRRPQIVSTIDALEAESAAAAAALEEMDRESVSLPAARLAAQEAVDAARTMRTRLPGLQDQLTTARAIHTAAQRLPALEEKVTRDRAAAAAARERHLATRERQLTLQQRRIDGMAAELAGHLRAGEHCAVCGATEHPAPAAATGDPVSEGEQIDADYAEKQAADRRAAAVDRLAAAERECAVAAEASRGMSVDAAAGEVSRLVAELDTVAAAASHLAARVAAVDEIASRIDDLGSRTLATRETQAALRERIAALRADLADLDAEVSAATGGTGTVHERRARLAALCRASTVLRDARVAAQNADARTREIDRRIEAVAARAGFADVAQAGAALADPMTIASWDDQIGQASAIRAHAVATLDDPEVAAAAAAAPTDLAERARHRDATAAALDAATQRHSRAADRFARLQDLAAGYWSALSVLAPVLERDQEVSGLADLVAGRGQNSRQMSLRSYVLAARLEEVLVAASTRLREMSSGRYEFAHTDAAASRGRRSGLGIEVRDEYTGAVRPATTLSGGETFFASLALALGLADVVSAESGGRVLDTMFIDEGFGTLDPEALDLVMRVLDDLRSGGRVVGVVSHVDEMKARIPAQLHVIRAEAGSRLAMVGAVV
ncbi:AAA family ATPase [Williamsia sp. MIQD14]|uniref:AAA family ATPase n=1 Tax=Williamsia sp. MIQD14 TaxID=3425703 RepID=UPI003DA04D1C